MTLFADRRQAGSLLLAAMDPFDHTDAIVLGIPRGGIPVAAEIAAGIDADLDVLVIRKIGAPNNPELAIGAVGPAGRPVWNETLCARLGVGPEARQRSLDQARCEVQQRLRAYPGFGRPQLKGRTVMVVDDGVATGVTMGLALDAVRQQRPLRLLLAVPVGAPDTLKKLARRVDKMYCLAAPPSFQAVGQYYHSFDQISDQAVQDLLTGLSRRKPH